jgi:hypothetical protein
VVVLAGSVVVEVVTTVDVVEVALVPAPAQADNTANMATRDHRLIGRP